MKERAQNNRGTKYNGNEETRLFLSHFFDIPLPLITNKHLTKGELNPWNLEISSIWHKSKEHKPEIDDRPASLKISSASCRQ